MDMLLGFAEGIRASLKEGFPIVSMRWLVRVCRTREV